MSALTLHLHQANFLCNQHAMKRLLVLWNKRLDPCSRVRVLTLVNLKLGSGEIRADLWRRHAIWPIALHWQSAKTPVSSG